MTRIPLVALALLSALLPVALVAKEPIDWEMVNRIRDEGFERSQVMDTLSHLTDIIGPRLTGSPAMVRANQWTRDKLADWGLENAHLEAWGPFGRGWSFSRTSVHVLKPRATPLIALPKAWTPSTAGPIRGPAMKFAVESEEDFEEYKGKLEGEIVFLAEAREIEAAAKPEFLRYSGEELAELESFKIRTGPRGEWRERSLKRRKLRQALNEFLVEEKALAAVDISSRDGGLVRVGAGGSWEPDESVGVPTVVLAAEHYNWILRLLEDEHEVELEIEVETRFHDQDTMAYDTIAEIPGSDKRDEIVMAGGHLDSWHPGAGSNDNAAGCAVAMEAVRILKTLGVRPRRTIRIGLWSGEEQGLLGSLAHVERHYATRPEPEDPEQKKLPAYLRGEQFPITVKPAHQRFSAYFNVDNGSGKIRGIYTQGNAAVRPIFEAWLEPFHDLGADTVTNRDTRGTDHQSFDRVGLPGFQFIQDRLDYSTRTHHTNMDVLDHAREEDLMQASVVLASFVYHAAMRDEKLPRKPMPQKPPESKKKKAEEEPATQ